MPERRSDVAQQPEQLVNLLRGHGYSPTTLRWVEMDKGPA
jgi:hypothetical protein